MIKVIYRQKINYYIIIIRIKNYMKMNPFINIYNVTII